MEPPLASHLGRSRLTRNYTLDDEFESTVPPSRAATVNDAGWMTPARRPSDIRSNSVMSYDGRVSNINPDSQGSLSPQRDESSRHVRSLNIQATRTGQPHAEQPNLDELGKLVFDLETVSERSSYDHSTRSFSRASHTTAPTSTSGYKLVDFFAEDVFQLAIHNPATFHRLLVFSRSRLCDENLEFLDKVDKYNALLNQVADSMFAIHRDYISVNAATQINIPEKILIKVNKDMRCGLTSTLPQLESVFVHAQIDIERLVAMDIYPRFVRYQMTLDATKALATDRGRYAGLGDCFVLTNPTKADNPIVYASDGFVKVTGYLRNEIIPRNCRFLQCRHTDRSAVARMRAAIDSQQESVELLLNQKKSGEPFWNLLYTTPLFDANDNLAFFLGGQVNCSTTIHNASDVLRILAMSDGEEGENADDPIVSPEPVKLPSRTSRFFSSFKTKPSVQSYRQPGMEEEVLKQMDKNNLRKQIDTFYTAYSKFLVVNYSTFYISFHSAGIRSLLYPAKPASTSLTSKLSNTTVYTPQIVGVDVFRFLSTHTPNKLGGDFKAQVRTAVRGGNPISLDLTLCTRRFMGYEKFTVHWTPLKNEIGDVGFIVVTLGGLPD
ncbi:hypothetical protein A1O1_04103 [Capronia coronata CBS 617.96]|uniref:RGS domain-containing protein n=1 Tax=Capronia coronata CBS 617.96 TaxID=1182541 RepID=W9YP41_9EURO|nr:uncharacterized protein A1O1_04103 [Capronia coronata CBS 617.96]EXJ90996.1 hypothetical protein A1O1_04103 [Capronia coronata CBS 617.96]